MKHITQALVLGLIALAVTGCGTTSNSVNNGGLIQKRKYTKGFYLNLSQRDHGADRTAVNVDEKTEAKIQAVRPESIEMAQHSVPATQQPELEQPVGVSEPQVTQTIVEHTKVFPADRTAGNKNHRFQAAVAERSSEDRSILRQVADDNTIKKEIKKVADNGEGAVMLLLLIILAFILPPLAVALYEGFTTRFLLDLIFWILGISSGLLIAPWAFVFLVVSIVYALFIVLGA